MNDISDERTAVTVWSMWLDGDSLSAIVKWGPIESRPAVRSILAGEPPAPIVDDPRYVNDGRFFWIAVTEGSDDAFVVVKSPRRYTASTFRKAVRGIRAAVRADGGDLNLNVIEGAGGSDAARETAALIRMVVDRGYRCYQFDADGNVSNFTPKEPKLVEAIPVLTVPAP